MRKSKDQTRRKMNSLSNPVKPALISLAIAQALAFQAAQAANIEVTSNLDDGTDCTLREALTTVNVGADQLNGCVITVDPLGTNDTITFDPAVAGQTITLAQGELEITKNVSINPGGVNTTIDGNQASRVMSVISNDAPDLTATLNQLTITGGRGGRGGGIKVRNAYSQQYEENTVLLALMNSTVSGNRSAGSGGGISLDADGYYDDTKLLMTNSKVSSNTAYQGGGIYLDDSSATLRNSTVSGNSAGNRGAGIGSYLFADVYLFNSTVSGNTGDGIYLIYGSARLENSTVSGNTGAGINGRLWLSNSTVSDNSGPGFFAFDGATLSNSIVANNNSRFGDCRSYNNYGPVEISSGPDTISTSDCGGATVADPLLGPLTNNGGPTETHALLPGSPAIDNATASGATAFDQRGVAAEGFRDSGAYEFTGAVNSLTLEKLINHRLRETVDTAAQLLPRTRYRAEYKVTNNSPNRIYDVKVFEDGQLVCNLYALDPGESKQPYRCASNQDVLFWPQNVSATVTAKVSGTNQALADQGNAYYTGVYRAQGKLKVTHYVNNNNADTQAATVDVNGNEAEVIFRVENTGNIELYRVNTFHDPASPVDSGWQQQCFIGTLDPGQVRYCKRTINVTHSGLNKAFGRAQGVNANVSPMGYVNASNPTYFNVVLP